MRIKILIALILVLLPEVTQAGWRRLFKYRENRNTPMYCISCADSLNCIVQGVPLLGDSFILSSADGGATWRTLFADSAKTIYNDWGMPIGKEPPMFYPLMRLDFVTPNLIIGGHQGGEVTISRDGGKTFTVDTLLPPDDIVHIDFKDSLNGFVMNNFNIARTTNSGVTWDTITKSIKNELRFFEKACIIEDNIYVCGLRYEGTSTYSAFYKSTDGGGSWTWKKNLLSNPTFHPYDIFFIDQSEGWIVGFSDFQVAEKSGRSVILHTTDAGENWETQLDTMSSNNNAGLNGIQFVNKSEGIAYSIQRSIWRTTNGGAVWEADTSFVGFSKDGISDLELPTNNTKRILLTVYNLGEIFLYDENLSASDPKAINMEISPNPVKDFISIPSLPSDRIEIYSQLGVKVLEATTDEERIDISRLPAGVYFIRGGGRVGKFVKIN
ncbi:MAG: T9SS type A sorting domain-containing protein [Chloroflexota bacterium]